MLLQHIATERTLLGAFKSLTSVLQPHPPLSWRNLSAVRQTRTDNRSNSFEAATFSYSIRQLFSRGPPRFAPTGRLPNFSSIASAPAAPILEAALLPNDIPAFEPFLGRRKPAHLSTLLRQRSTSPDARRHLPLWLS